MACRTAGFNSAVRAVTDTSYYGRGNGTVWLDNVQCTGSEETLFDCSRSSWGVVDSSCNDHSKDAAVVCSDGKEIPAVYNYTWKFDNVFKVVIWLLCRKIVEFKVH